MKEKLRIGLAMCGSFCTFSRALALAEDLAERYDLTAIVSETAAETDTRFGAARAHLERLEAITGKPVITTIPMAEPIGPEKRFDVLLIAPCTGNTISKIANATTDTCVAMAAKANLRNRCPLVLGVSTNDGLGASAKNIGILLNCANVYFVPFTQDDPIKKPDSLVADMSLIVPTLQAAMEGRQYQPVIKF